MDPERRERVAELLEQARAGALSAEGQRELAGEYEDLRAQLRIDQACSRNAERTLSEKTRILSRFAQDHGAKRVVELLPYHAERWLQQQLGWGPDYQAKVLSVIRAALNWARKRKLIASHPLADYSLQGLSLIHI